MKISSRYAITAQTHNAVSIGASSWSVQTSWIDTDGYDKLAVTLMNDAGTTSSANVQWSNDGITQHGETSGVVPSNNIQKKDGIVDTRARYAKVSINNADTSSHTISAWVYLKS